jgi:DNA-binding transcriptional LysR family regulator
MKATIAQLHSIDRLQPGTAELELVLALIRGRTLHGAAERLQVDASTVFRAIRRLEKNLGETLFERGRQGYVPNQMALNLGGYAERIESHLQEARDAVSRAGSAPSGVLRVTTTDTILHHLLLPLAASFSRLYPGIELELVATNSLANLSRREADVAIRATRKPPEHLVGVKLGTLRAAVFASKEYLASGRKYPDGVDWVALDDSLPDHPSQAWRRQRYPKLVARHRVNSVMSVAGAIVSGMGVGVAPLFIFDGSTGVRIVEGPLDELDTELWCLAHPDARYLQRVKLLFDFLRQHVVLPMSLPLSEAVR